MHAIKLYGQNTRNVIVIEKGTRDDAAKIARAVRRQMTYWERTSDSVYFETKFDHDALTLLLWKLKLDGDIVEMNRDGDVIAINLREYEYA